MDDSEDERIVFHFLRFYRKVDGTLTYKVHNGEYYVLCFMTKNGNISYTPSSCILFKSVCMMTFLTDDEEELAMKYISIAGLIRDNNGYVAVEKQQIQDGTETLHQATTEEEAKQLNLELVFEPTATEELVSSHSSSAGEKFEG